MISSEKRSRQDAETPSWFPSRPKNIFSSTTSVMPGSDVTLGPDGGGHLLSSAGLASGEFSFFFLRALEKRTVNSPSGPRTPGLFRHARPDGSSGYLRKSPNSRKTTAPTRFVGPFMLHQGPISGIGVRIEKQRPLIVRYLGVFRLRLFGGNESYLLLWTRQDAGGHS